jgi:hypothetical protein
VSPPQLQAEYNQRFGGIMPLFFKHLLFLTFIRTIQSYILSSFISCQGLSCIIIASPISKRSLHGVPSRESKLGLRHSKPMHSKPMHYQLSHADPNWSTRNLIEPCLTLIELRGTLIEPQGTLIEPGRTLIEPCRTLIEPCRTLIEPHRTLSGV